MRDLELEQIRGSSSVAAGLTAHVKHARRQRLRAAGLGSMSSQAARVQAARRGLTLGEGG